MSRHAVLALCALALIGLASRASATEPRPFTRDSLQAIEIAHAGAPFVVVMWATDCAPCRRELKLLAGFRLEHPSVPVVLIATDDPSQADGVAAVLREFGLADADNWQFADGNVERLRYAIDPVWYGEIPRAYLYSTDGSRRAVSGPLAEAELAALATDRVLLND